MMRSLTVPYIPEPYLEHEIRLRAYCIYLQRGNEMGGTLRTGSKLKTKCLKNSRGTQSTLKWGEPFRRSGPSPRRPSFRVSLR
jgi:hypothetical protein